MRNKMILQYQKNCGFGRREIPQLGGFMQVKVEIMKRFEAGKIEFSFSMPDALREGSKELEDLFSFLTGHGEDARRVDIGSYDPQPFEIVWSQICCCSLRLWGKLLCYSDRRIRLVYVVPCA